VDPRSAGSHESQRRPSTEDRRSLSGDRKRRSDVAIRFADPSTDFVHARRDVPGHEEIGSRARKPGRYRRRAVRRFARFPTKGRETTAGATEGTSRDLTTALQAVTTFRWWSRKRRRHAARDLLYTGG
jgi:hypothetical protein